MKKAKKVISVILIILSSPFLLVSLWDYFCGSKDSIDIFIFCMFLVPFIPSVVCLRQNRCRKISSQNSTLPLSQKQIDIEKDTRIEAQKVYAEKLSANCSSIVYEGISMNEKKQGNKEHEPIPESRGKNKSSYSVLTNHIGAEIKNEDDTEPKPIISSAHVPTIIEGLDPFFVDSGKFIIEKGKASIGMLQRMFKIGFNRATRIMDQLFEAGVVGSEEGAAPRKILMTWEEFDNLIEHPESIPIKKEGRDKEEFFSREALQAKEEIPERLSLYNNKFDYMEGHDFEKYCTILLKHIGYYNVEVTKGSNDNGVDILAMRGGVKYGIQCKCYSSDIGVKAVQEAFSGAKYYDCHVPVVLTNRYFTKQAQDMAKKTNVLLWDRNILIKMVETIERARRNEL